MFFTILTIILVVAVLVGINALYVSGEFSTVSARKIRVHQLADEGNTLARILLPVLENRQELDRYIAASQVGITLASLTLGIYGERQIAPLIDPLLAGIPTGPLESILGFPYLTTAIAAAISSFLVLITLTTLQVVLGELVPKSIGLQYPETMAFATTLPMKYSADYLLAPLIWILNGSGRLVLKLFGVQAQEGHEHIHSPEEILILVKESHQAGLLDATERQMLRNVFRVTETAARDIAIPRPRLVAADASTPLFEILSLAADSAYSRIPIYVHDIDHVVGFVHFRDLFELYRKDPSGDINTILREAPFVPEALPSLEVWDRMNESRSYLAFVVDEYGGFSGMITREDLIEELFGELQDEFDQEPALITPAGEGRVIVRGDMPIEYLNELLDLKLPHEVTHTIGGLVQELLGHIPKIGESVDVDGVRLEVDGVVGAMITSVCINLPSGFEANGDFGELE